MWTRDVTVSSLSLQSVHLMSKDVFMIFVSVFFVGSPRSCAAATGALVSIFRLAPESHLNAALLLVVLLISLTRLPSSGLCIQFSLSLYCLFLPFSCCLFSLLPHAILLHRLQWWFFCVEPGVGGEVFFLVIDGVSDLSRPFGSWLSWDVDTSHMRSWVLRKAFFLCR